MLCELLLRGPQTPGELRSRAERMHHFDDLGVMQTTLQRLMKREPPVVKVLPREPGTKEARYAHICYQATWKDGNPRREGQQRAASSSPAGQNRLTRLRKIRSRNFKERLQL